MLWRQVNLDQRKNVWRVLVVEDDPDLREFFAASVTRCAEPTLAASLGTVADALAWLAQPDGSGL